MVSGATRPSGRKPESLPSLDSFTSTASKSAPPAARRRAASSAVMHAPPRSTVAAQVSSQTPPSRAQRCGLGLWSNRQASCTWCTLQPAGRSPTLFTGCALFVSTRLVQAKQTGLSRHQPISKRRSKREEVAEQLLPIDG